MLKIFYKTIMMMVIVSAWVSNTYADDGTSIYNTSFSNSTYDNGFLLCNSGYYYKDFISGKAGKSSDDVSLNFIRHGATYDSLKQYNGDNIYTYVSVPVDKSYIMYEINFMPGSDDFKSVRFATQGHGLISANLYCNDDGTAVNYVLNRYQWNKITYIFHNNSLSSNSNENNFSVEVSLYVNGKRIQTNAQYTAYKTNKLSTETTTPIRFVVYGKDSTINGMTEYSPISAYMDDINIGYYDEKPLVKNMPYLIDDENRLNIDGNTVTIYETITPNDLKCSDGASIRVFDTPTYDYNVVENNPLNEGNVIAVSDEYNQISYYTVHKSIRNQVSLSSSNGFCTASAFLNNASMIIAGYDESNALVEVNITNEEGDSNVSLVGKYAVVKAFIVDNLANLKPLCSSKSYLGKPTIACWGDSLTIGQGCSNVNTASYPAVLATLSGLDVLNMGIGGETAMTIAARQGGMQIKLDEAITIPASGNTDIKFSAYNTDGSYMGVVAPRSTSIGGWNPCVIGGVEGTLTVSVNSTTWPRTLNSATFTRKSSGEPVLVEAGETMVVDAQSIYADINIIFIGTNGGWNSENKTASDNAAAAQDLVSMINKMLAKTKYPDKFVVIGLTTGGANAWDNTNEAMRLEFGDNFLDVKNYLSGEQALLDANIIPTQDDAAYIEAGKIPPSLLNNSPADNIHLNDYGYKLMAMKVYERLKFLGYIE